MDCRVKPVATIGEKSDVAPFDLLAQRLHHVADVLKVRVDRQRAAVGLECVFVVADFLQDQTEAGQRTEVTRLARQHLANIGERVAVILLRKWTVARRFQASV